MAKQRLEQDHIQTQTEINRRFQDRHASIDTQLNEAIQNIDKKRREEAAKSLNTFIDSYLMGVLFEDPPSDLMRQVIDTMQTLSDDAIPTQLMLGRGVGKTTVTEALILWLMLYGYKKFLVIVGANARMAQNILRDIWRVISDTDTPIAQDFPQVCLPYALTGGATRRRQLYNNTSTDLQRTSTDLAFPRLKNEDGSEMPTSGSYLTVKGITSGIRGCKRGKLRPDIVIMDDIQTSASASAPDQVEKLLELVKADILNLSSKEKIGVIHCCTPICEDDLTSKLEKDPNWRTLKFPYIIKYPDDYDKGDKSLWTEYFKIYDRESIERKPHKESLSFYKDHQMEMDKGSSIFCQRYSKKDGQISGLQAIMDKMHLIGERAFSAEYQMQPVRHSIALPISPDIVASRISDLRELEIPSENVRLVVASSDLNVSKYITTVILACMRDGSYVVIYREFYKTSIQANVPPEEYDRQLYNTLSDLGNHLKSLGIKINCWSIDGNGLGWNAVTKFAKHSKSICGIPSCSFVGKASHLFRDHISSRLKESVNRTILCGDKDEQKKFGSGIRYTFWDSDWYREKVQKGFLQAVGNLGSISWYKGSDHTQFALQICSEKLIDKKDQADGTTKYSWRNVGKDWDALDALAQALACYGSFNFSDNTTGIQNISQKRILRFRKKSKIKII